MDANSDKPELATLLKIILNSVLKNYSIYRAKRDEDGEIIDFVIYYRNFYKPESEDEISDRLKYILKKSLYDEFLTEWISTPEGLVFPLTDNDVLVVHKSEPNHEPDGLKMQMLLGSEEPSEVIDRVVLNKLIRESIFEVNKTGKPFVFGLLNIDGFEKLQTKYGTEFATQILENFSEQIQNLIGDSDELIKLDGNSFALLLRKDRGLKDLISFISDLSQQVGRSINVSGEIMGIEFSAGYVLVPHSQVSINEIYELAESLMYRVKSLGKNGFMTMSVNNKKESEEPRFNSWRPLMPSLR